MTPTRTTRAWRRDRQFPAGRISRYTYIRADRLRADAARVGRRLSSQVFERPVPTLSTDPFEQLAAEYGLRVSVERISLAPRDLAAPAGEIECCYLMTVSGPEGGTAGRLAFVRSVHEPNPPTVRDALWWLASDAWAVERSGGDAARWAERHRLTPTDVAEFEHYRAQSRSLATALGADAYDRLLSAYESSLGRDDALKSILEEPSRQQPRP